MHLPIHCAWVARVNVFGTPHTSCTLEVRDACVVITFLVVLLPSFRLWRLLTRGLISSRSRGNVSTFSMFTSLQSTATQTRRKMRDCEKKKVISPPREIKIGKSGEKHLASELGMYDVVSLECSCAR